jgi:hypothetical protein
MRAVVTGMVATFPVGGVFYDYVQYALGLERLGFEVYYLEDTRMPCLDPETGDYDHAMDGTVPAARLAATLGAVSPSLGQRWHYRGADDATFGVPADEMAEVIADADLFLNVSGSATLRDAYLPSPNKVYVDTDPGWNHFMRWTRVRADPVDHGMQAHDHLATYAERLGQPDCPLPDLGRDWHPTRPPVVAELWEPGSVPIPGPTWTTVMSWDNAPLPIEHDGVTYGTKEREFARVEHLPSLAPAPLEVAAGGAHPPVERWREAGWSVVDAMAISRTPEAYRDYLQASRGEFSIAKHVYVATRSGWFSCRSTCYLAAGRPVVVQDTGFSEHLPTGEGVLSFADADEALSALRRVEADYDHHAEAARRIADEQFGAEGVLGDLCDRLRING